MDRRMIWILYLKSSPDIGSPTQLTVVYCASEWLTIPCQWSWQTADTANTTDTAGHTKLYSSQLVP